MSFGKTARRGWVCLIGLLAILGLSSSALADDAIRVMVAPFGEESARKTLFDALELELELEEDLLVSDAAPLFEELLVPELSDAESDELAEALRALEQDAVVQATFLNDDQDAVVLIYRATDGLPIFGQSGWMWPQPGVLRPGLWSVRMTW